MFSGTLVSIKLEVNDAFYLKHLSDNEYTHGKTSDRKSNNVQRNKSIDETSIRMTTSGRSQITRNRDQW